MGYLMLQGGSEFGGRMKASDLRAMELAGGPRAAIRIIPAAAAPDHNHDRAGQNGRAWFQSLGAVDVEVLPLIDRGSADVPQTAEALRQAKMIYLLGGFPGHLAHSLASSAAWNAMQVALAGGAVLAGSSAGAMVLCQHLFDPQKKTVEAGLGLIGDACVIPHHNRYGGKWSSFLRKDLPRTTLIGIDEQTGMISDGRALASRWNVYGRGEVTLYHRRGMETYGHGQTFDL